MNLSYVKNEWTENAQCFAHVPYLYYTRMFQVRYKVDEIVFLLNELKHAAMLLKCCQMRTQENMKHRRKYVLRATQNDISVNGVGMV